MDNSHRTGLRTIIVQYPRQKSGDNKRQASDDANGDKRSESRDGIYYATTKVIRQVTVDTWLGIKVKLPSSRNRPQTHLQSLFQIC